MQCTSARSCLAAVVTLLAASNSSLGAQAAITASRTDRPPRIDGRADDTEWQRARPHGDFVLFAPREGGKPVFGAEARVLYDERTIYVLVRAFDAEPEKIERRLMRRDTYDAAADHILVFLDTYQDRRSGYQFAVTPAGVKLDFLLSDDVLQDASWDGVWDVATRIDSAGWVAEFAIPLHQMRVSNPSAPAFGIIIGRWVGRTGERSSIPQYRRSKAGLVSQFGLMDGVRDLRNASGLETAPYVVSRVDRSAGDASTRVRPTTGLDVRWMPTARVALDATVNPDFGQIEADPAVLNLSGVEVYQVERRPFFKEGAGLLNFSLGASADVGSELFYSRRVGRSPSLAGYAVPGSPTETTIQAAGRLSARLTPTTSVMALSALTGEMRGGRTTATGVTPIVTEPRTHYGVARLQREFRGGRSGVGMMFTRVDRDAADSLATAILPTQAQAVALAGRHLRRDGAYQLDGWAAASDVRGTSAAMSRLQLNTIHAYQRPDDGIAYDAGRTELRGTAARISAGKYGGVLRFSGSYRYVSPGFDVNDAGFFTTAATQRAVADVGVAINRPGNLFGLRYRNSATTLRFEGDWATAGTPYARTVTLFTNMQLTNLAQLLGSLSAQLPGSYCSIFCTRGGPAIVDPPAVAAWLSVRGDPRRRVMPSLSLQWDQDDEGRSRGFSGQLDALTKLRSNLNLTIGAYAADADRASFYYGRFGDELSDTARHAVARLEQPTRSLTGRVDYTVTTTLTAQLYAQAFVSRGAYTDLREIDDARNPAWNARFRPLADTAVSAHPGGIDYKQFRSNAVVRWEYRPGSALFVVWSQGRDFGSNLPGSLPLWPGGELGRLFDLAPRNTFAVKLSYWLSR